MTPRCQSWHILVETEIFHDEQVGLGVTTRRSRDGQDMRRRAEHGVDDIEFETRRAATGITATTL